MKNKTEEKVEETPKEEVKEPKLRQILIETDGTNIRLTKSEVYSAIELIAILQNVVDSLKGNK